MNFLGTILVLFFLGISSGATPSSETIPVAEPLPTTAPAPADATTADLAMCITDSGAKFYGAYWCPHCADQKKLFGDAMQYIDYIECDAGGENAQPELCTSNNITSYPTWIFADGERLVGTQEIEVLASQAGCL
ncbi:MAG: hypothetical protein R3B71_03880 [Candidatus Gracilibacteria bacterium]|nr:hypothetical protein [Candidatus Peregrinibacteria bacterium]